MSTETGTETETETETRTGTETQCGICGEYLSAGRWALGYRSCLACGEEQAKEARLSWCVAPMHKSNYVLVRDRELLIGLNQKGGLVK